MVQKHVRGQGTKKLGSRCVRTPPVACPPLLTGSAVAPGLTLTHRLRRRLYEGVHQCKMFSMLHAFTIYFACLPPLVYKFHEVRDFCVIYCYLQHLKENLEQLLNKYFLYEKREIKFKVTISN